MIRFILFQTIICFFTIANASNVDQKAIDQFKYYLKEIKSIAAEFHQTDSQGTSAEGKLLIHKPYKFRCNYYSPFPLVIIGNKNYVSVYDYDMEQLSRIKFEENIFNFLLADDIEFDKHFIFKNVLSKGDIFEVTLYHSSTDRLSKIIFDKNNRYLKSIEIFEGENIITLNFHSINKVSEFDEDLFILKNPDIFRVPKRLSKDEIEKKYKILN